MLTFLSLHPHAHLDFRAAHSPEQIQNEAVPNERSFSFTASEIGNYSDRSSESECETRLGWSEEEAISNRNSRRSGRENSEKPQQAILLSVEVGRDADGGRGGH